MSSRVHVFTALALVLTGCGSATTSFVKTDTTLGRVVVYRNGVAYFERYADVQGDTLRVNVPQDKVNDFLKSLTVVDAASGKPAPITYPTDPSSGEIDMKIGLAPGASHRVKLSYVTEAPSWKPTYRAVVGADGKVSLQAWAIVDNTSGEDWKNVKLGVGSSSAMAFRFDLRSLRLVERETLRNDTLFATAPPLGGAAYAQLMNAPPPPPKRVLGDLDDGALAMNEKAAMDAAPRKPYDSGSSGAGGMKSAEPRPSSAPAGSASGLGQAKHDERESRVAEEALRRLAAAPSTRIVVEGYSSPSDKDKSAASYDRANRVRDEIIKKGADPNRVVAAARGADLSRAGGGVRVVEEDAKEAQFGASMPTAAAPVTAAPQQTPSEPIGTSHFESGVAMTVPKGTSAMVSVFSDKTEGQIVYLFDAETSRGNDKFAFRALRFKNPTESTLESGPVSVFGEGRFIGEGMAEPIPVGATAFVPFALDRQVTIDRKDNVHDEIQRVVTVQRGVLTTEMKQIRRLAFTLSNRQAEPAVVFVRHTTATGFTMDKAPPVADKLGNAQLYRVELPGNAKSEIILEESTPVRRTIDIRTPEGLSQIRLYATEAAAKGPLKDKLDEIVRQYADVGTVEEQIHTLRTQMGEYRTRVDELHAQIVTLKAVKSAGPLMVNLEKKMQEASDHVSKATIDIVSLEEKKMVLRIKLEDAIAELTLEKEKDTRHAER